ncbi:MAG: asparagine synthase-related protein [Sulfuricaulis sp.]|uniref:asparagine synthetase B family protein n=1 Tax=Sulfuricaulis sp. TaxID=2003553 RepID=UPI0025D37FEF|nr:asparagine synthase-related protein [Sulfuricaulis sp.]MCR4347318.1 asparagine synthase-related protein [Sulfuricaulis sp.]
MLNALSRPGYKVGQYADESGTIALGCADLGIVDRGIHPYSTPDRSVTVCLYGDIYSPRTDPATTLAVLAKAYRDKGPAFLNDLVGEFFLVILDHGQHRLILANDRYGRRPVYYSTHDGQLVFSSEIKALLASGAIRPDVDPEALADVLTFGLIPGERTLLRQVQMLPPAGLLEFDLRSGELATSRYWDLRLHLQPSAESEAVLLDRLTETFSTAVERRLSPSHVNWLSLSAGMDSRTIASVINSTPNATVKAITLGFKGGYERKVTSAVAATIGVEHSFHAFDESQFTQSESEHMDLVREAVALTDGMRGTASSALTAYSARQNRRLGLDVMITGHGGEIAKLDEAYNFAINTPDDLHRIRTQPVDWTYNRLFRPNAPRFNTPSLYSGGLAQVFADAPRHHLQTIIEQVDANLPPEQLVSFLFLNELFRKRAVYALAVQRARVEIRVPFYDDDFLATVVTTPLSLRTGYKIHRYIIKRYRPELLEIVLSETRMRPFPSAAERLFRGLPYKLATRLGLFKRDVPEHYFAANADTNFFRSILQDPMTLDRGYFNPRGISSLLDEHARGRHSLNTLLHLLTIVELWHRDFLDTR